MTSKIVVNNIEADSGINTVTFGGDISGNFVGNVNTTGVSTFSDIRVTGGTISGVSTAGITTAYINTLSGISTIDASSAVSINQNLVFASGKGIDFSATANSSGTMTSELLSDYEEGTWTPDLRFAGSNTGITYSWRNGHYTKIGRQVTVRGAFGLSSRGTFTATDRAAIYGLPFGLGPYDITGGFNYSFVGSYTITVGGVEGIHAIDHKYESGYVDHFLLLRITAANTGFSEMQYQHVGDTQRIAFVTTYFTTT